MKIPFLRTKSRSPEGSQAVIPPVVQPADMDEEYRQRLRLAAQTEIQTIVSMRDRVMAELITTLRWVQASLLLVNGGAAVAIIESTAISATTRAWAGAFFVIGIMLSLFTATTGVAITRDAPRKFTEIAGYWIGVSFDLQRVEATEREWRDYAGQLEQRARFPRLLGYTSAIAFVIGCVIVGANL